jgi:signal transduction histidine kinase
VNYNDPAEPLLPTPSPDARAQALVAVFARWSDEDEPALPVRSLDRLHAALEQQLPDDGSFPPPAPNPLEQLERDCLSALLAADALDARTLAAVHGVFAAARSTPDGALASPSLQHAWAARDRQLSIATHELRTPISSILLNLQLLERTARQKGSLDTESVVRLLAVPSRQLRRLTRMVDLLLDSAQVENERLVLDPQPLDLCELVHDAAGRLAERFRETGCALSLDACQPVQGRWDRLRLEQVVTNLLTNALKYGGGRVEVRTHAGNAAVLAVHDNGPGIPPEDRERIFRPFERLRSAAGEDGAGLGLYIVREIVRAHGGRVEVTGEPGEGTTFTVVLPI